MPTGKPGRPFKFPDPGERSPREPAVMCPADRVLALYNQVNTGKPAEKVSNTVRKWFDAEARKAGWLCVKWFKDVATDHGAGCVLATVLFQLVPPQPEAPNMVPAPMAPGSMVLPAPSRPLNSVPGPASNRARRVVD